MACDELLVGADQQLERRWRTDQLYVQSGEQQLTALGLDTVDQMYPLVEVIIPVKTINGYLCESIPLILAITPPSVAVIVLTDSDETMPVGWNSERVRVVATTRVGPGEKRDMGVRITQAPIIAFLDDDAFPDRGWLEAALPHFANQEVSAVGGPNITPPTDSFWQQVSGLVYSTWAGAGGARNRYLPSGPVRDVDDWPTVNLLVRRADFEAVGGFDTSFFPGEDTKLCLDLTVKLGKRIVYEPRAIVFHHRRSLFWGHFQQVGRYAFRRGNFVSSHPDTSRRLLYFLPSMMVLATVGTALASTLFAGARLLYAVALAVNLLVMLAGAVEALMRTRSLPLGVGTALGLILSHWWYGVKFLQGVFSSENR